MTQEEKAFRQRLVDEMHSGQKTLAQIQQELADYQDPDAAELRRYRAREPLVQKLLALCDGDDDWAAKRVRDFKLTP